jgi:carboxyl-terminal processing protease
MSEVESTRSPMRIIIITVAALAVAACLLAAGIGLGFALGTARAASPTPADTADQANSTSAPSGDAIAADCPPSASALDDAEFGPFWEAWNAVEDRYYYDLPSAEERMHGAIRGMMESLGDKHSSFMDPSAVEAWQARDEGEFEGIGAWVDEAPLGGVLIISVFKEGPADLAGIRGGDVIVEVNGEDVTEDSLDETLSNVRGPAGTDVTLGIVREGEEDLIEITVTRELLEIPITDARMLDDNVGYVALYQFNAVADERLRRDVQSLLDQGAEYLILDLRGNGGGYLDQALSIGDFFLDEGVVMIERDVDGNEVTIPTVTGESGETIPLVVLIDGGSASASEIVAGAIQDEGRGTLIGETSYGKGSVQELITLSDGTMIRVTMANWYTPNDNSITDVGISPDIEVVVDPDTLEEGEDPALQRAIEFLLIGQ